jgi:leucyl aminopeptidase (aminopeptidase T)
VLKIDADENAEALRGLTAVYAGARRLGELALVDDGTDRAARHCRL